MGDVSLELKLNAAQSFSEAIMIDARFIRQIVSFGPEHRKILSRGSYSYFKHVYGKTGDISFKALRA